jgi:serine/threonine protein kinase
VIEWLGSGGQADVYRAVHPQLPGRDVVVKWAKCSLTEPVQRMLLAEGAILARLDEQGLVRVYDADVHEGRPFVVMEYVPGRTLEQQLKERLPHPREAAKFVALLAGTLARVHGQGVCHRDLKPSNVLVDQARRPRVLDFGLALMDQPWAPQVGSGGGVSGTL